MGWWVVGATAYLGGATAYLGGITAYLVGGATAYLGGFHCLSVKTDPITHSGSHQSTAWIQNPSSS